MALGEHDNIVFDKIPNVDDVFEGYDDETQGKVIVVAEKTKRFAFFTKKPELGPTGNLLKRVARRDDQFNAYRKGKKGFMAKSFEFKELRKAKAFASNPNAEKKRQAKAGDKTKATRDRFTKWTNRKVENDKDFRKPKRGESFYKEEYEDTIYKHFPKPGEEVTCTMKREQSKFFEKASCDARKEVPKKNMYGKEKKFDHLTFSLRISGQNLSGRKKAALQSARHTCRQIYNAAIFLIKKRSAERLAAQKEDKEAPQQYTAKELRHKVYDFKNGKTITVGMKNCAEHIVSKESLRTTEELVRDRWNQIPSQMKEDAVQQAT